MKDETKRRIAKVIKKLDGALLLATRYAAAALLLIGAYFLFDTFYVSRAAFTSYDLLQYKPEAATWADEESFAELKKLNPDSVAWLTLYDTNIDYPVVQGRDNFEYAGKNVYGESSLTGAIYLDSEDEGFGDWFSLIYGHHMDNGAMFGEVDRYTSQDFLQSHSDGFLQTPEASYRLTVFACAHVSAYNDLIYHYSDNEENRRALAELIEENAFCQMGEFTENGLSDVHKLIVLSTCESGATYGRLLLFADAIPGSGRVMEKPKPTMLTAIGHFAALGSGNWAALNLFCLLATFISLVDMLKRKDLGFKLGGLLICIAALFVFFLTENLTKPVTLHDGFTWIMYTLMVLAFILNLIAYHFRGRKEEQLEA